jgi:hypothetical protein
VLELTSYYNCDCAIALRVYANSNLRIEDLGSGCL